MGNVLERVAGLSNDIGWPAHESLRDLLRDFARMGELAEIDGADSHLEISALAETVTASYPGEEPALLFDNIPGYKKGFRILSGAANSYRRLAHVLGLPQPRGRMDIVRAYKSRMRHSFAMTPPLVVATGPVLENVWRDAELAKFPTVAEASPELKEQVMGKWPELFGRLK
jgi:3-polyprenyl-4-hydroxybenzoate decarboxylase